MSAKTFNGRRATRQEAEDIAQQLVELGLNDACDEWIMGGSYRRGQETCGDVDIIVKISDLPKFTAWYDNLPFEKQKGFAAWFLKTGEIQTDLFLSSDKTWGIKCLNYTGPVGFNVFLAAWCSMLNLKFTRGGIYKDGASVSEYLDEKQIFDLMKMDWIEPQQRQTFVGS